MKKILSILLFFTVLVQASAQIHLNDEDDENVQYVSWGLSLGPNLTGYRMNVDATLNNPDKAAPSLGAEAGIFFEYHIAQRWSLQLVTSCNMERINLIKNDTNNYLTTLGLDFIMPLSYRLPAQNGSWLFYVGPYTHFVFYKRITEDGNVQNPYTRVIANDPRTDEPRFAMSDLNAGLAMSAGYEFANRWQVCCDFRWSVSDLLNVESHELFVKPFKATIRIGYHFF